MVNNTALQCAEMLSPLPAQLRCHRTTSSCCLLQLLGRVCGADCTCGDGGGGGRPDRGGHLWQGAGRGLS